MTIESGITNIGQYAFCECRALESVTIPASVTTIGKYAFSTCIGLTSVSFAEGSALTTIGDNAFVSCKALKSITIPASVTAIGDNAFADCRSLTSITIPKSVITIGYNAFSLCTGLTSITIPKSVTTIGYNAFSLCTGLTSVSFAEGSALTTINGSAFENCAALTSIIIPEGVTAIRGNAFEGCTGLESVAIPASVTAIGDNAFYDCAALESVTFERTAAPTLGTSVFEYTHANFKIYIPEGATGYIGEGASTEWRLLENEIVAEKTWNIGAEGDDSAVKATLSKDAATLTITGSGAMKDWGRGDSSIPWSSAKDTITTVTIRSGITNIGNNAFWGCKALESVDILEGVTTIGQYAFSGCTVLETVTFAEGSQLETIGNYAFQDCTALGSITIPAGVTNIGNSAFLNCTALTSIIILAGVKTIGDYAFFSCIALTTVTFAEDSQLTTIGGKAFSECTKLTSVTIPKSVTTIGDSAFNYCTALTTVIFKGTIAPTLGSNVFDNTHTDLKITIPKGSSGYIGASASAEWKALKDKIEVPAVGYTITFNASGGSVSPASATTAADGKLATQPIPTSSGNYRFDGWFTAASGGTAVTTATVFTANTTIYARWTYTGGSTPPPPPSSGGSSSGGGSNVIVTPPAPDKPNDPTQAEIKVDTKVDGKGGATVSITDKNITDAIKKGAAEAKKNGDEANGIVLVLRANTGNKTVNTVTVNLPKTVQEKIISNKIISTIVVVDNPNIKISMDLNTITEINKQAKADVNLTATKLDSGKLTGEAKTAIGTRPVFDLGVNYGSKSVSSFGGGSVTVSIPYTLQSGEKAGNVYGVYVDGGGKAQWISGSSYDAVAKVLRFSANHFSTYGVGYRQDAPAFTDIANHWAKSDIEFVVARGLLSGTSGTTFSPNTAMSRGMFVTALGRLAGIDVKAYKTGKFTDVKADAYYAPYANWAASKGITSGTTATTFAPDQTVTRQEMAAFMANYAKTMGYTLPKTRTEVTFADNASIGSWAAEAVKSMQMAGVIMGKDGNRYDPTGTATRAEVSAVLHRYVELVIDRTTAQGLDVNDSGKIVYYENGKLFVGTKTIDGTTYHFGNDGICTKIDAAVPDTKKYIIHKIVVGDTLWDIAIKNKCTVAEIVGLNGIKNPNSVPVGTELKIPQK